MSSVTQEQLDTLKQHLDLIAPIIREDVLDLIRAYEKALVDISVLEAKLAQAAVEGYRFGLGLDRTW